MDNPIKEIICTNWQDFEKKHKKHIKTDELKEYIYRGQYNASWPLYSSFQRYFKSLSDEAENKKLDFSTTNVFGLFLSKYTKYYNNYCINNTITVHNETNHQLISTGQHYGLPTPYLDWTTTLYNACFFAFSDEAINPSTHENVAVYALRIKKLENLFIGTGSYEFYKKMEDTMDFLFKRNGLNIIYPNTSITNKRIQNQNGCFTTIETSTDPLKDIIQFLKELYSLYNIPKPILYKFIIPRSEYKTALLELKSKSNICFSEIYPDLEGCAKQAKLDFLLNL